MLPVIEYSLAYSVPTGIERQALSALTLNPDHRWHERMDHALFVVTARHEGSRVGVGIVHNAITAPTQAPRPLELGGMFVHPAYRRLGIRQHMAESRLTYALSMGGTPITVIARHNQASWDYYGRSIRWTPECDYLSHITGRPITIWVSTESPWNRNGRGLVPLIPAQPNTVLPHDRTQTHRPPLAPGQDNAVSA